ncbi:hypothetical protein [Nocardioides sp.]|uniref:beta strand repeat-containing protein n=1 Tax=Nocardioides sp. TaxID=35761 RepID=UPI002633AF7A|nr:hypothetical protein [Nocardioides sp.]MDI6911859.1 hypothetical protein [Nocardioides sp.]
MSRSGIKSGLAVTAVTGLALAGLPLLASPASANPLSNGIDPDAVTFYSQYATGVSAENDGSNSTISLVVGGGTNVNSVQFRATLTPGGTPINIGSPVARNVDGVFGFDWAPSFPAGTTAVEFSAIPNTGVDNTATSGAEMVLSDGIANTVELSSEGSLGVFQSPYAADSGGDYVGVSGTTSDAGNVELSTRSANPSTPAGTATASSTVTAPATDGAFSGVLNIDGYTYSGGAEPNQIALGAATQGAGATDDVEASTLYVQHISTVSATASRTNVPTGQTADVTVTVKDQNGKPVANALVDYNKPDGSDPDTLPDDSATAAERTDARGVATFENLGAGTYTFYANTTSEVDTQSAGDVASAPVTITEYVPTNTTLAASTVDGYRDFDLDEVSGAENGDDFVATLKDQHGEPIAGEPIEYSWHFVPGGGGTPTDGGFTSAGTTDAKGQVAVPFPTWGTAGTYTLSVRRPNVNGSGLLNGTPVTVDVAESEITFADGDAVGAPVNGSVTIKGTLALVDGSGSLGGRTVTVSYNPGVGGDASFSTDQPAGTERDGAFQATAVTAADGSFSVSLTDPSPPPNVPPTDETGTLTAVADGLNTGDTTPGPADATDSISVTFRETPTVSGIDIGTQVLAPSGTGISAAGPGVPVDLDITVRGADGDDDPSNDPKLGDVPVQVSVDKGFLSPNAESTDDLTLASGHDRQGDLWGYFQNDGADETVTTADSGSALGTTGLVAAIEKDAGFDDDGLTQLTVTVKAGDVTQKKSITYDVRALLNAGDSSFERAQGEPAGPVSTTKRVDFQLYVHDQFGNLAGDEDARVTDDSPIADFDTDEAQDKTLSDFVNSGPGVTAFSDAPTTQTLKATMTPGEVLVDAAGNAAVGSKTVAVESDPVIWVKPPAPIVARLSGVSNGGRADRLTVKAPAAAAGAKVKLYKVKRGKRTLIATGELNANGKATFRVKDRNGKRFTKYVARVMATDTTKGDTTNKRRIR